MATVLREQHTAATLAILKRVEELLGRELDTQEELDLDCLIQESEEAWYRLIKAGEVEEPK